MVDETGGILAEVPTEEEASKALRRNKEFVGVHPLVVEDVPGSLGLRLVSLEEVEDENARKFLKGLLYERPDVQVFQVGSDQEKKIALVVDHRDKGADFGTIVIVNYWDYTDHRPSHEVGAEDVYILHENAGLSIRSFLPPSADIKMRYTFWREPPEFSAAHAPQEGRFAVADRTGKELWLSEIITASSYHGVRHELGHLWADYLGLDLVRQSSKDELSDQEVVRGWMLGAEFPSDGLVLPSGKLGHEAIREVSYSERLAEVIAYVLFHRGKEAGFSFGEGSRGRGEKGLQYYDAFFAPFILKYAPNPQAYFASRWFRTTEGVEELRATQSWIEAMGRVLEQALPELSKAKETDEDDFFESGENVATKRWLGVVGNEGSIDVTRSPGVGAFSKWKIFFSDRKRTEQLTWSSWEGVKYFNMNSQQTVSVTNLNAWSDSLAARLFLGKKAYEFVYLMSRVQWQDSNRGLGVDF